MLDIRQLLRRAEATQSWRAAPSLGEYWPQMLDIARRFTLARIMKCCQIMGRKEGSLTAAQILYPLMQCTDVFYLKVRRSVSYS